MSAGGIETPLQVEARTGIRHFLDQIINEADAGDDAQWVKRGRARFFVLHRFSPEESASLTTAVRDTPHKVRFYDGGGVRVTDGFLRANPLRPQDPNGPHDGFALTELGTYYKWGEDCVLSRTLLYLLLRASSDGKWRLCYNPLHRKQFRDFYASVRASEEGMNWLWGASVSQNPSQGVPDLDLLFQRYCKAMEVRQPDGSVAYADPTCHIFLSQEQCAESSLVDNNLADFSTNEWIQSILTVNEDQINKRGIPTEAQAPRCVCLGEPASYVKQHMDHSDSFVNDFQRTDLRTCNYSETNINCSVNINVHQMETEDTQISNECGNEGIVLPSPPSPPAAAAEEDEDDVPITSPTTSIQPQLDEPTEDEPTQTQTTTTTTPSTPSTPSPTTTPPTPPTTLSWSSLSTQEKAAAAVLVAGGAYLLYANTLGKAKPFSSSPPTSREYRPPSASPPPPPLSQLPSAPGPSPPILNATVG